MLTSLTPLILANKFKTKLKPLFLATSATFLVACGNAPKAPDNTPLVETSVLSAKYVINGYILPDSHGEQTVYTLADRRRIDLNLTFDSWASRVLLDNTNTSMVARLDKNLSWDINRKENTYTECAISGCANSIWDSLKENPPEEEGEEDLFDPSAGESCNLTTSKFDFTVTDKKNSRTINGFQANQYTAQWLLVSSDEAGLADKHTVIMDFWMTVPTNSMKAAWDIHGEFQNNYLAKVVDNNNPLSKFFGEQIYKTVAMVSGDIKKQELNSSSPVVEKLNAIPGYPISIKLQWFMDKKSCPEAEEAKKSFSVSDIDMNDPLNSIKDLTGGFFKDSADKAVKSYFMPDPKEPIFNYIYDVTSVNIKNEHLSVFDLPAGAKLINRK